MGDAGGERREAPTSDVGGAGPTDASAVSPGASAEIAADDIAAQTAARVAAASTEREETQAHPETDSAGARVLATVAAFTASGGATGEEGDDVSRPSGIDTQEQDGRDASALALRPDAALAPVRPAATRFFALLLDVLRTLVPASVVRWWAERQTRLLAEPLREAALDPERTQQRLLRELLDENAETEFGRSHGFAAIDGPTDYARRVPVRTASEYQTYLERAMDEPKVLVSYPPLGTCRSWGTRGAPLAFPLGGRTRVAARKQARFTLLSVLRRAPHVYPGRAFVLPPPAPDRETEGGLPRDEIPSAIPMPPEIAAMQSVEARWYAALRIAAGYPVTVLVARSPSAILHLGTLFERHGPELIDDLESGTINQQLVPEQGSLSVSAGEALRPQPQVATRLREHVRVGRVLRPRDLWPRLGAVVCRRLGQAARYLPTLDALLPDVPMIDTGYACAQGVIASTVDPDEPPVVDLTSCFVELIPVDRASDGVRASIADAVQGTTYRVVLTSGNGVYRYDVGDLVEVLRTERGPALRLVGRAPVALSAVGENVTELQVEIAMKKALSETSIALAGFAAAVLPRAGGSRSQNREQGVPDAPRYVLAVEPYVQEGDSALQKLAQSFDRALGARNRRYAERRASDRLASPAVWVWKAGAIDAHRRARAAAGAPDPLLEPPVLCTDPSLLAALPVARRIP